ncbi:MAG: hypothetical protein NZ919_03250 [Candidatus Caldarchaeum sp.]|nr:hypothetical protein [Candidatus Caldarchaeum sp.]
MHQGQKALSVKNISFVALSAAFYVLMAAMSGLVLPAMRGYPAHFFRGLAMSAVAAYSGRMWSTSFMAVISGLVLMAVVPAPAPYLLFATAAAGVVYDISLGRKYAESCRRPRRVIVGTMFSGFAEAVVAMSILTYVGLFQVQPQMLAVIWVGAIAANLVLSVAGAQVSLLLLRRYVK